MLSRWQAGVLNQIRDLRVVPRLAVGDVVAGVSVAAILIPQSLAYASLAGLPESVGLIAAAVPLMVFALLASSPCLQTGPVAITSLLTAGALQGAGLDGGTSDYVSAAALLAVLVGLIRLIVGGLRLGSVVYLMAEPVMAGFTSGAAVVIISSQLPRALGVDLPPPVADWANPVLKAAWALSHIGQWAWAAIIISLATLLAVLGGRRLHRVFPGVLVAIVAMIIASQVFDYQGPVVSDIDGRFPQWSIDLPWSITPNLLAGSLVIALVGFAEPAAIARTYANQDRQPWASSREFIASGLANAAAGLSGAFPVGGSFSRSSINRLAGAQTRWSGAITGLTVLLFLPFAGLLNGLPQAVLGAVVIGAVWGLLKPHTLIDFARRSRPQGLLAITTFAATILSPPNIHWAVLGGVALTVIVHLVRPFKVDIDYGDEIIVRPHGLFWLGSAARFKHALATISENPNDQRPVIIDLSGIAGSPPALIGHLTKYHRLAARSNHSLKISNPPRASTDSLTSTGAYGPVIHSNTELIPATHTNDSAQN